MPLSSPSARVDTGDTLEIFFYDKDTCFYETDNDHGTFEVLDQQELFAVDGGRIDKAAINDVGSALMDVALGFPPPIIVIVYVAGVILALI